MNFIMNDNNEVDYIDLNKADTILNIFECLEIFFNTYVLNCHECNAECCSIFPIRPDNVFMKNLDFIKEKCNGDKLLKEAVAVNEKYQGHVMPIQKLYNKFFCKYVNNGKCDIYANRPILCRLYTCQKTSVKWRALMNLIVNAYKDALEYEIMEQTVQAHGSRGVMPDLPNELANPVLYADDYSVQINQLIMWAVSNGRTRNTVKFFYD